METNLYSLFDRVAQEAAPIFHARNDAVAIRSFHQMFEGKEGLNINDFRLYHLGKFCFDSLKLTPLDAPREVFSPGASVDVPGAPVGVGG